MIATHTVLWAAGMKTTPLADRLAQATGAGQDRQGRFFVDAHLNPEAHPEIYVIGDMAHHEQDDAPLPGIAPSPCRCLRSQISALRWLVRLGDVVARAHRLPHRIRHPVAGTGGEGVELFHPQTRAHLITGTGKEQEP